MSGSPLFAHAQQAPWTTAPAGPFIAEPPSARPLWVFSCVTVTLSDLRARLAALPFFDQVRNKASGLEPGTLGLKVPCSTR